MNDHEMTAIPAAPLDGGTWALTVVFAMLVIGVAAPSRRRAPSSPSSG